VDTMNTDVALGSQSSSLKGRTVWITGASTGIGRALAIELARRGSILAISARTLETLQETSSQIEKFGGQVHVIPADVVQLDSLQAAVSRAEEAFGRGIDMHIACAGTHVKSDPLHFNSQEYLALMDVNYGGMLRSFEAVLPGMLERGKGYLVGVASMVGYRGMPSAAAYGASKAAMNNFLESILFHLKPRGISVSVVNPGFVKTPLTDKNEFQMPFLVSAEDSARIIANGLERGKREISYPAPFNWFMKLMRILPFSLYQFVTETMWRRMNRGK
jgi:short-subunit dehydrogenase